MSSALLVINDLERAKLWAELLIQAGADEVFVRRASADGYVFTSAAGVVRAHHWVYSAPATMACRAVFLHLSEDIAWVTETADRRVFTFSAPGEPEGADPEHRIYPICRSTRRDAFDLTVEDARQLLDFAEGRLIEIPDCCRVETAAEKEIAARLTAEIEHHNLSAAAAHVHGHSEGGVSPSGGRGLETTEMDDDHEPPSPDLSRVVHRATEGLAFQNVVIVGDGLLTDAVERGVRLVAHRATSVHRFAINALFEASISSPTGNFEASLGSLCVAILVVQRRGLDPILAHLIRTIHELYANVRCVVVAPSADEARRLEGIRVLGRPDTPCLSQLPGHCVVSAFSIAALLDSLVGDWCLADSWIALNWIAEVATRVNELRASAVQGAPREALVAHILGELRTVSNWDELVGHDGPLIAQIRHLIAKPAAVIAEGLEEQQRLSLVIRAIEVSHTKQTRRGHG